MKISTENQKLLDDLSNSKKDYLDIASKCLTSSRRRDSEGRALIYSYDFGIVGIVQRSLSLISGFCILIEKNNFLSAIPLVRLHMDSLLTLYAASICHDPHAFIDGILMEDKEKRDFKDKTGHNLTDGYLLDRFFTADVNEDCKGLEGVYRETSKYIHFSKKHIISTFDKDRRMRASDKDHAGKFLLTASETLDISDTDLKDILMCMTMITASQLRYLYGWYVTKNMSREELSQYKAERNREK